MCSKILDLKAHGVAKLLRYFPQISETPEAVHIVILVEEMSCVVWLSNLYWYCPGKYAAYEQFTWFVHGKLERGVNYRMPSCVMVAIRQKYMYPNPEGE